MEEEATGMRKKGINSIIKMNNDTLSMSNMLNQAVAREVSMEWDVFIDFVYIILLKI